MPQYWTDELSDQIARDASSLDRPASLIAWACLTLGPLIVLALVLVALRIGR